VRRRELKPSVGRSVQGRTLYQRDVIAPEPRIRVLVVGAMHGDELSSASVALHWIQMAVQTPSNVPTGASSPRSTPTA
jgi:murein peptide amidase A